MNKARHPRRRAREVQLLSRVRRRCRGVVDGRQSGPPTRRTVRAGVDPVLMRVCDRPTLAVCKSRPPECRRARLLLRTRLAMQREVGVVFGNTVGGSHAVVPRSMAGCLQRPRSRCVGVAQKTPRAQGGCLRRSAAKPAKAPREPGVLHVCTCYVHMCVYVCVGGCVCMCVCV